MRTLFKQEKGLTLVEILASLVILAIIFISVLLILTQTMKTNKVSEEIIDATYVAQTEMEKIYAASKNKQRDSWFKDEYVEEADEGDWNVFSSLEHAFNISILWQESCREKCTDLDKQMTRVVVKVYDKSDVTKVKAQMENLLKWEEQAENEATP